MVAANAGQLLDGIPACVKGCFQNGVDATGCDKTDYDCYCYAKNHEIIVDTVEVCLINQERRLEKNCTEMDMFQYENRYWMVCEQYWEPTGTATEPASATITATSAEFTSTSSSLPSPANSTTQTPDPSLDRQQEHHKGLLVRYQIAIGVSVSVTLLLVAAAVFLWFKERKKRRVLEEQHAQLRRTLSAENGKGPFFEMEGDERHVMELVGDPRAPELEARPDSIVKDNVDISIVSDVQKRVARKPLATPPPETVRIEITNGETPPPLGTEIDSTGRLQRASLDSGARSLGTSSLTPPPLRLSSRSPDSGQH